MKKSTSNASLQVFAGEELVGTLWLDDRKRFSFQYAQGWLAHPNHLALSHTLPLQSDPFLSDHARPFFSNLLPEYQIRRMMTEALHISEQNDFALLEAIGGECAGAISLIPMGQRPLTKESLRLVSEAELGKWLANLSRRPLMQAIEGLRMSLAGAQNKLPVVIRSGSMFLPEGRAASSHILKPEIERLTDSVLNEVFCMRLAADVGLPVPRVEFKLTPAPYFLIERYDRVSGASGHLQRIHQEDFCQALGVLPENKYEAEGGPTLEQCFQLLADESVAPLEDRRHLLRWVIFNVLIGNADAHAKNIAMLRKPDYVRLAPFYDLLCTAVYPNLASTLAMRIGGEKKPAILQARHWGRLAEAIDVKESLVRTYALDLAKEIVPAANKLISDFPDSSVLKTILGIIEKNARQLKSRFAALWSD